MADDDDGGDDDDDGDDGDAGDDDDDNDYDYDDGMMPVTLLVILAMSKFLHAP